MIIIYGKSASGKSSVLKEFRNKGYKVIIPYTTRPPRTGEVDGIDYHFISENDFLDKTASHFFLINSSYETSQGVWRYGTSIEDVNAADGKTILIMTPDEIKQTKEQITDAKYIYIYSNRKTLEKRLKERGDSKEVIEERIARDSNDFRGAEELADKIFYNNDRKKVEDIVVQIIDYVEGINGNKNDV